MSDTPLNKFVRDMKAVMIDPVWRFEQVAKRLDCYWTAPAAYTAYNEWFVGAY